MQQGDTSRSREPQSALRAISYVELDFPTLFEKYYGPIARYLMRQVDRHTAEDLASMTFREAYDRRATYDCAKGSERAWLFGIATHLFHRHLRSEGRRLRAYDRVASLEVEECDECDEILARLDARTTERVIADALQRLARRDYEVLTLHCWAELSDNEIAVALGIPTGTVKSRLYRARHQMRAQLSPSVVEPNDG